MTRRPVPYRFLLAPAVLVAVVLAFALGRATAPDAATPLGPDCSGSERNGLDAPEAFAGPNRVAYFSQCERRAASPTSLGGEWGKVNVYADSTGDEVIAWWYQNCGYPEGIVEVGAGRPTTCSTSDTTGAP